MLPLSTTTMGEGESAAIEMPFHIMKAVLMMKAKLSSCSASERGDIPPIIVAGRAGGGRGGGGHGGPGGCGVGGRRAVGATSRSVFGELGEGTTFRAFINVGEALAGMPPHNVA